jgi:hypothetical protein
MIASASAIEYAVASTPLRAVECALAGEAVWPSRARTFIRQLARTRPAGRTRSPLGVLRPGPVSTLPLFAMLQRFRESLPNSSTGR